MGCGSRIDHSLPHRLGFKDLSQPEQLRYADFDFFLNNVVLDAGYINTALNRSISRRDVVQTQVSLREHGRSFLTRNWILDEAMINGPQILEDQIEQAWKFFDIIAENEKSLL